MYEKLVELRRLEYKDGAIWRTHFVEERWVDADTPMYSLLDGLQVCTLSTKRLRELKANETFRKKKV